MKALAVGVTQPDPGDMGRFAACCMLMLGCVSHGAAEECSAPTEYLGAEVDCGSAGVCVYYGAVFGSAVDMTVCQPKCATSGTPCTDGRLPSTIATGSGHVCYCERNPPP